MQAPFFNSGSSKTTGLFFLLDYIPLSNNYVLNQVLDAPEKTADIKAYEIPDRNGSPTQLSNLLVDKKLKFEFDLFAPGYKQRFFQVPQFEVNSTSFDEENIPSKKSAYSFSVQLELLSPQSTFSNLCEISGDPSNFQIIYPSELFANSACKVAEISTTLPNNS